MNIIKNIKRLLHRKKIAKAVRRMFENHEIDAFWDTYIDLCELARIRKPLFYVVFDDDLQEGFSWSKFKPNFILTNNETGLTDADCKKAIKIISKNMKGQ